MNGFLERLPKPTSEEINLTIPMFIKEMEFVVKSLPTEKNLVQLASQVNFPNFCGRNNISSTQTLPEDRSVFLTSYTIGHLTSGLCV